MDHSSRIAHIEADGAVVGDLVRRHGVDSPVEHCGDWRVLDLVGHLGRVHRWAARVVAEGYEGWSRPPGPAAGEDLADWFAAGCTGLVETLRAEDAERECWTFGVPPARVWFWPRRQCLETAVHRWDAQHAVHEPAGIDAEVAADGLDELVELMFPLLVARGQSPALPAPVQLVAVDVDRAWTLPGGDGEARAELTGTLEQLFLHVWGRGDGTVAVSGDDEVVAALRAAVLVP